MNKNTLKKVAGLWVLDVEGKKYFNPSPKKLMRVLSRTRKRIKVIF